MPGLYAAARRLGVNYSHAYRVWLGQRQSPRLLAQLRLLIEKAFEQPPADRMPIPFPDVHNALPAVGSAAAGNALQPMNEGPPNASEGATTRRDAAPGPLAAAKLYQGHEVSLPEPQKQHHAAQPPHDKRNEFFD
jgi:hypothetical protein